MYHYIEDKDFLKRMKSLCSDIINQLVQSVYSDRLEHTARRFSA